MQRYPFKRICPTLVLTAMCAAAFFPAVSSAQTAQVNSIDPNYTLLAPLPCLPGVANCTTNSTTGASEVTSFTLDQFISYAYKFLLALAVVLAVFMITIGGFEYMTSSIPGVKNGGLTKIQDAIMGLLLALCAYLILYTIDPKLVAINATIPSVCNMTDPTTGQLVPNGNCDTANHLDSLANIEDQVRQATGQALGAVQALNNQAQQVQSQADELYSTNGCEPYGTEGDSVADDAPPACKQVLQLINQANNYKIQGLQTAQVALDKAQMQQLSQALNDPSVTVSKGCTTAGVINGCYNGYQLSGTVTTSDGTGEAIGAYLQTVVNNAYTASQGFQSQAASISNGSQASIITEAQATAKQIDQLVQARITQGQSTVH